MSTRTPFYCVLFVLLGLLAGCSSSEHAQQLSASTLDKHLPVRHQQAQTQPLSDTQRLRASLMQVFQEWEGSPYRYGGETKAGIDCSAFVQKAFLEAQNLTLPRTTWTQVQYGKKVNYDQAKLGDLVFFKTSRSSRHVGIYLGNKQFMHASTSKGVIISQLNNPYWASKFWHFRRISSPPTV